MSNRIFNSSDLTKRVGSLNIAQQMYGSFNNGTDPLNPQSANNSTNTVNNYVFGSQTVYERTLRGANRIELGGIANYLPDPFAVSAITVPDAPIITSISVTTTSAIVNFTIGSTGGSPITNYKYSIDNGSTLVTRSPASITSPITISGLTTGTTYQILIIAVNSVGDSLPSNMISATPSTTPGAPTITSIIAGNQTATVNFTAGSTGGLPITNYEYSTDNGSTWNLRSPASTTSPIVITGLVNGTPYSIRIRAINSIGSGTQSNVVSVTPATTPSAPTIDTFSVTSSSVTINFTAPISNGGSTITNYKYSINNGSSWVTRSPVSTTSPLIISGLTTGTTYQILILAVNSIGDGLPSNMISATPGSVPGAPTITSIVPSNQTATVNFTTGTTGGLPITNYEYSTDNGSSWNLRSPASTTSPIVITGLVNGTSYPIRIRAINSLGSGTQSNAISVTPATTPDAPTITGFSVTSSSVTVNFTAPISNGGSAITNYKYSIDNGSSWVTRSPTSTTSPLIISGLTTGTTYQILILAVNSIGDGLPSNMISATPGSVPGAPTITSTLAGNTTATIYFTAPTFTGGVSITNYEYSINNGSSWVTRSPTNTTSPLIITDLSNNVSYQIRIRAVNAVGSGTASGTVTVTPSEFAQGIVQWAVDMSNTTLGLIRSTTVDSLHNIYICGRYRATSSFFIKNVDGNSQSLSPISLPATASGLDDVYIIKYNSNGIAQWAINMSGDGTDDSYSIVCDTSNNIYITGTYNSSTQVTVRNASGNGQVDSLITLPTTINQNGYIVKYNSDGIAQWAINQNSNGGSFTIYGIASDSANNIYITGIYTATSLLYIREANGISQQTSNITIPGLSAQTAYIIKYNSSGVAQWATYFKGATTFSASFRSITVDSSDFVYVSGFYASNAITYLQDVNNNTQQQSQYYLPINTSAVICILKYNSAGISQWSTYFNSNSFDDTYIKTDASNNVYAVGTYQTTSQTILKDVSSYTQVDSTITLPNTLNVRTVYLIKYNSSGIVQWATYYGQFSGVGTFGRSITTDYGNNIYISGQYQQTSSSTYVMNASGTGQANSAIQLSVTPGTKSCMYLIKYNTSGQAQWATNLIVSDTTSASSAGSSLSLDPPNNLYVGGAYTSNLLFTRNAFGNGQTNSTVTLPGTGTVFTGYLIKYN
jgi:hypothetical protein